MREVRRIKENKNGEIPRRKYDILRVVDIDDAEQVLENFKAAIIAILENKKKDPDDPAWEALLPAKMVTIAKKMEDEDFANDDLVFTIESIVEDVLDKDIKEWDWYSSKLTDRGFEVYFEGNFESRFTWFVRFQNIPLSKISIESDGEIFPIQVLKDVFTYRKFD